jgi:hypothetical protein
LTKRTMVVAAMLFVFFFPHIFNQVEAKSPSAPDIFPPDLPEFISVAKNCEVLFIGQHKAVMAYGTIRKEINLDGKVIIINQPHQIGAAYDLGKKILDFDVLTGDCETPTYAGIFRVELKSRHHISRRYGTQMPYALFFDRGRAIHEGDVPPRKTIEEWASHGCVRSRIAVAKKLFKWANIGTTLVIVQGKRQ